MSLSGLLKAFEINLPEYKLGLETQKLFLRKIYKAFKGEMNKKLYTGFHFEIRKH